VKLGELLSPDFIGFIHNFLIILAWHPSLWEKPNRFCNLLIPPDRIEATAAGGNKQALNVGAALNIICVTLIINLYSASLKLFYQYYIFQ
jgi:hypothetical protein